MSFKNNMDSTGLLQEQVSNDENSQKPRCGLAESIQNTDRKKNFETFLFDSDGKKYFFVVLYGPN